MNYKQAPGRNWSSGRSKRRPFKLDPGGARQRLPETLPPPGRLEHRDAAGRNWARDRSRRSRARPMRGEPGPGYPLRERGGADHDLPYRFSRPSWAWTFPFSAREFARLLVLRGRIGDGHLADDLRPVREAFSTAA